jgi:hypothetical protein
MFSYVIAQRKALALASSVLLPAILFTQLFCDAKDAVAQDSGSRDIQVLRAPCQTGPWIKNLTAPNAQPCPATPVVPNLMSRKEAQGLAATASSPEEHLRLAEYYRAQAISLEAEGAQYEKAAALYSSGPKNIVAPGTAGRYRYYASNLREEAKQKRMLAEDRVEMAKKAAGGSSAVGGH